MTGSGSCLKRPHNNIAVFFLFQVLTNVFFLFPFQIKLNCVPGLDGLVIDVTSLISKYFNIFLSHFKVKLCARAKWSGSGCDRYTDICFSFKNYKN